MDHGWNGVTLSEILSKNKCQFLQSIHPGKMAYIFPAAFTKLNYNNIIQLNYNNDVDSIHSLAPLMSFSINSCPLFCH
jgi:hypothetical protein